MQIRFCVTCSAGAFSPIAVVRVENTIRAADRFNIIIAYTWAGQRPPPWPSKRTSGIQSWNYRQKGNFREINHHFTTWPLDNVMVLGHHLPLLLQCLGWWNLPLFSLLTSFMIIVYLGPLPSNYFFTLFEKCEMKSMMPKFSNVYRYYIG